MVRVLNVNAKVMKVCSNFFRMSIWADKFGEELWDLAEKMTKAQEIKMVRLVGGIEFEILN